MPFELYERIALSQFGRQRIPDPWSGSSKTPIAVSAPCASNSTRHWIGWAESAWSRGRMSEVSWQ